MSAVESWKAALGKEIAAERKANGWSQTELGNRVDMSQKTVSEVERGANTILDNYLVLTEKLDVDFAEIALRAGGTVLSSPPRPSRPVTTPSSGPEALFHFRRQEAVYHWALKFLRGFRRHTEAEQGLKYLAEGGALTAPESSMPEKLNLKGKSYKIESGVLSWQPDPRGGWSVNEAHRNAIWAAIQDWQQE